jgi:F-type H+-transporting ATPase subunit epsilon
MAQESIELQIVTPQRHILQDDVDAVEIPGKDGYLGVLPGHAPLITELGIGILAYRKGSETRHLTVIRGYAEVLANRVIVLAEVAEKVEEIDSDRARAAQERAKAELAKIGVGTPEWQEQTEAIERAAVRLQAVGKGGVG